MYDKRFYKIYDHQQLKTQALKKENPKMFGSYSRPSQTRVLTWALLSLSRHKDQALLGFKFLKSHLCRDIAKIV